MRARDGVSHWRADLTGSGTPFLLLLVSLGALTSYFLIRPALSSQPYYRPRSASGYAYWYLVAATFVPYAFAIHAYRRGARPSVRLLLAAALVLYIALIPAPAQQSQDLYQSLLYGKMAVQGHNPYVVHAASFQDPWRAWALWEDTPSVYGPIWTLITAGIVKASAERLIAAFFLLKAATAALALFSAWALAKALNDKRRRFPNDLGTDSGFVVLVLAFNPMVLFSVGLGAHADVAVAAALAGAVLADQKGRDGLATLLLAVAALVKPYAALVLLAWLICLARRRGMRTAGAHGVYAAALAGLAYSPFWEGLKTFSGVSRIGRAASTSITGTVIRLASGHPSDAFAAGSSQAGTVVRAAAGLFLAAALIAIARSERTREEPWRAGALLFAVYVLVTPWYLYWHLIGLVALAAIVSDEAMSRGTLIFSGSSLFVGSGGVAAGLAAQTLVRYAPPLAAAAQIRWRTKKGRPENRIRVET